MVNANSSQLLVVKMDTRKKATGPCQNGDRQCKGQVAGKWKRLC